MGAAAALAVVLTIANHWIGPADNFPAAVAFFQTMPKEEQEEYGIKAQLRLARCFFSTDPTVKYATLLDSGNYYLLKGDYRNAQRYLDQASKLEGGNMFGHQATYGLMELMYYTNRLEIAEPYTTRFVQMTRSDFSLDLVPKLQFAEAIYRKIGRKEEANAIAKHIRQCRFMVGGIGMGFGSNGPEEIGPDQFDAYNASGSVFNTAVQALTLGRYDEAVRYLKFVSEGESSPDLSHIANDAYMCQAIVLLPVASFLNKDYKSAEVQFEKGLKVIEEDECSKFTDDEVKRIFYEHYALFLKHKGEQLAAKSYADLAAHLEQKHMVRGPWWRVDKVSE